MTVPVDFMLVLVACMDALEARWDNAADPAERARVRRLLEHLDTWLERCLDARFAHREAALTGAEERLDALQRRMERQAGKRDDSPQILGEISSVLERLDNWWETLRAES